MAGRPWGRFDKTLSTFSNHSIFLTGDLVVRLQRRDQFRLYGTLVSSGGAVGRGETETNDGSVFLQDSHIPVVLGDMVCESLAGGAAEKSGRQENFHR